MTDPERATIGLDGLDALVGALRERGYCVVGPTRRDGAIVYEEIASADELPAGWTEVQEAASYRLDAARDEARFGYPVGPHSWKRYLLPAQRAPLAGEARRTGGARRDEERRRRRLALCSACARATCTAIAMRGRVFLEGELPRRATTPAGAPRAFFVVVNCGIPGNVFLRLRWAAARRARAGTTSG